MSVAHVEDLERLAPRGEVQAPVGEHAVDIEHQELDLGERRGASGARARRFGAPSNDTGAHQVVHVERADHDIVVARRRR